MQDERKCLIVYPIILMVFLVIAYVCTLVGCTNSDLSNYPNSKSPLKDLDNSRFYLLDDSYSVVDDSIYIDESHILIDRETGIEYLYTWNREGRAGGATLVMLCNQDGTPKVNKEWQDNNGDQ